MRTKRRQALANLDSLMQAFFLEIFGGRIDKGVWPTAALGDLIEGFESGKSIVGDDEKAITPFRVLKVSAVGRAGFRSAESKPLPAGYMPPASHIVHQHDLLFSRANTADLVGGTAYVWEEPTNVVLPDKLWRFKWKKSSSVTPLFIQALFQQPWLREEISRRATGTSGSMKNISQEKVLSIRTPIPPKELQESFSKRVEFTRLQFVTAKESSKQLDRLFAGLQDRAFKGEL